jgi:hypothetical protein
MRFVSKFLFLAAILALAAGSLFAQTTGSLSGVVTQDGNPLPGVSVAISSPNLQGERTAVTNDAGGYNFSSLPPGDYTVRFELAGMQTVTKRVHVGVSIDARAAAELKVSAVSEAITVTAAAPAVAETNEVQTNFTADVIEALPVGRSLTAITGLSPGVVTGVNGLQISGGQSFDNLYTVNGVVVQENLRGQPHNLFIEDAIQETTVQTAGISAEFGNFTGGVINAITKSGGNEFSGSFRDNLTNGAWTEVTGPTYAQNSAGAVVATIPNDPIDHINSVYEATLGGRIIRDRLWFFLSGRDSEATSQAFFSGAPGGYTRTTTDKRKEAKLTGALTSRHNLVVSYLEAPTTFAGGCQIGCYDLSVVDPSGSNPNEFITGFYNGVITNNLLIEGRYAKKTYSFVGYGGEDHDRVTGTVIRLVAPGFGTTTNEPYFCGSCGDENRDNDTLGAKTSYFLGTKALGNHSMVAGVERWHETRLSNNFQSTTDYVMISQSAAPSKDANGNTLVTILGPATGRAGDYVIHFPILSPSLGSDLNTDSLYFNDKWDLNSRWQFNLGARYDKNDSIDSAGNKVAKDSKISPRLGATFDAFGNGRLRFNATWGTYVGRLAETIAGLGSAAGNPAQFNYRYQGPDIVSVSPEEAMKRVWAWYDSQGGVKSLTPFAQSIPGASSRILGSLNSPSVDEWTVGASTQIGNGFLRADVIRRDGKDFYTSETTLETGRITLPSGAIANQTYIVNSNDFERTYDAVELQGQYRFFNRLNVGANYTWSQLKGNYVGETSGAGPVTEGSDHLSFPEYSFDRNNPVGFLGTDQTHKFRGWVSYDLATVIGSWNFSLLENFDSGSPYSLTGTVPITAAMKPNPGYVTVPTTLTYYISDRGAIRFDDITRTDLSVNYNTNPSWLHGVSLFVQAEMLNVLNEENLVSHNTAVLTSNNNAAFAAINPYTTSPGQLIECPQGLIGAALTATCGASGLNANFQKGPLFGKPTSTTSLTSQGSYQLPRTYRFSLGVRF